MTPKDYSTTQVTLHWLVVLLVLFQVFLHDDVVRIWTGRMGGTLPNEATPNLHVAVGLLILVLVVWRLVLRLWRGVPAPPASEHPALKVVASATHILFYVLLLGMPISGSLLGGEDPGCTCLAPRACGARPTFLVQDRCAQADARQDVAPGPTSPAWMSWHQRGRIGRNRCHYLSS